MRKTDKFGWDRMDQNIRTILRKDWMDALADFTLSEIDAACKEALHKNPDKCPNEAHVRSIILKERAEIRARMPRQEPETYSALSVPVEDRRAQAAKIMAEVFAEKKIGGEND